MTGPNGVAGFDSDRNHDRGGAGANLPGQLAAESVGSGFDLDAQALLGDVVQYAQTSPTDIEDGRVRALLAQFESWYPQAG